MNVTELTASIYGTNYNHTHSVSSASSALSVARNPETGLPISESQGFSNILSNYVNKNANTDIDSAQASIAPNVSTISAQIPSMNTSMDTSVDANQILDAILSGQMDSSEIDNAMLEQITQLATGFMNSDNSTGTELFGLDESNISNNLSKDVSVMNLLTDAEKAKEYLSSQSGRQVLIHMMQNEIAGIVTGGAN